MCTSKKLKILRQIRNITQSQLSDLTGIHLVSIKKYETDKMKPERHIRELSDGLNISKICLCDSYMQKIYRLKTVGDIYAIIISLIKQEILILQGQKDCNDKLLAKSIKLSFNSIISNFISNTSKKNIQIDNLEFLINLSTWEYLNRYDKDDKTNTTLEQFELELFSIDTPLQYE